MAEHHQPGAGRQALLQGIEDPSIRRPRITTEMLYRKHVDAQFLATGQLDAGRHHPGVFAVADQQAIARLERQTKQRQHAATGDVLAQRQTVGRDAAEIRQPAAGAGQFCSDVGPDVCCERSQLLNALPAGGDGLQRWGRQGPLAAVVEIGLVQQGRTVIPEGHLARTTRCAET